LSSQDDRCEPQASGYVVIKMDQIVPLTIDNPLTVMKVMFSGCIPNILHLF
jgi:hypothetical protein